MELDADACYRGLAARDARFDGRWFAGVRTTRIYCRPVCPARTPRRENVTFFASAVAAQAAGFRPCLRCRPESAPDFGAWRGTSNTVSRGLALIGEGGLDEASVDGLAARLGVGERQLRRLFRQHLGASPVAVAQTRRVLFARQLIAETRLPMADIALAAGFGSVRRFNAVFQALYQRSPGALRRSMVEPDTLYNAASAVTLRLPYARPYDWDAMVGFLAARAMAGLERVDAEGRYWRTIGLDGAHGWFGIAHDAASGCLRATIWFPRVASLARIVGRIRRLFDLAVDPAVIGRHFAEDDLLRRLVMARPGLRVAGAWDGFELAVRGVLGQQITVAGARNLGGRLVARLGAAVSGPDGLTHVFPEPGVMAAADLRDLGMPGARARCLSAVGAAAVAEAGLFTEGGGALARLRAVPGIGEWTAQYIAMRAWRDPDAFPAGDVALQRAAAVAGVRPGAKELLARSEAWRPWRAYAAAHLWASLGDVGETVDV
jgi:AraC family transcriptional regulator of adaptative response / DNA-3-methyladenine glycosylase II